MLTPWEISPRDIELIRETLTEQAAWHADHGWVYAPLNCLEWGSGGSTVVFSEHIAGLGVEFKWQAIEHDPVWRQRVADEVRHIPSVSVSLVRCDGDPHREPMDDYVDYPLSLGRRFNFVFIDGRKRRRCLEVASKLLAVGGVVILHDADRAHYGCAFDHFTKHERIGDKLWRGWIDA